MKAWLGIVLVGLTAVLGCGGSSPHATTKCLYNSDCATVNPLYVCALGYCVSACHTSSDCPSAERCVIVGADVDGGVTSDGGAAAPTACQAPESVMCLYNSQCTSPLVCSGDKQCRDGCQVDRDCPIGQKCTTTSKVCVDPVLDKNEYNATTNELVAPDGGVIGPPVGGPGGGGMDGGGGVTATDGGATDGPHEGGSGGSGGAGGAGPSACTGPQIQFSDVIKGDANPGFTTGVGVRSAGTVFIFSAYQGVLPGDAGDGTDAADAGPPMGSLIYAQALDATTGASLGPAAPFLTPAEDGPQFFVDDVAVAPTGEIALLYSHTAINDARRVALFAAFLSTTAGPDGGAPVLHVEKTVQLESVPLAIPHVVWSATSQTFVISWKFDGAGGNWTGRYKTYSSSGVPGTGSVGIVPTRAALNDQNEDDAHVGTAGPLVAMAVRDSGTGLPSLTIMGSDGLQVGGILPLGAFVGGGWMSVGGTKNGFVAFYNNGTTIYASYAPTTGGDSVIPDAGAPDGGDGGVLDGGMPMVMALGSFASTIHTGHAISDDPAAGGGAGAAILEDDGAIFVYVTADASKQYMLGSVISSPNGKEIAVTNYHGSFSVSLYNGNNGVTDVVTSTCGP